MDGLADPLETVFQSGEMASVVVLVGHTDSVVDRLSVSMGFEIHRTFCVGVRSIRLEKKRAEIPSIDLGLCRIQIGVFHNPILLFEKGHRIGLEIQENETWDHLFAFFGLLDKGRDGGDQTFIGKMKVGLASGVVGEFVMGLTGGQAVNPSASVVGEMVLVVLKSGENDLALIAEGAVVVDQ
jgi:hypothetical protein